MKNVAVLFGGVSAEHDVSVITGLQVAEKIDRKKFVPHAIKLTNDHKFEYYKGLSERSDYLNIRSKDIVFCRDNQGAYIQTQGLFSEKVYIDVAYLAFHGGDGESGQMQGFLETLGIPYTSPSVESSAVVMNKSLTKEVLSYYNIPLVPSISFCDTEVKNNLNEVVGRVEKELKLPVIIKPSHLGSSIAINIAKTKAELKKHLMAASHVDEEILVEKLVKDFTEYNVAVRKINGKIETSEVEKPLAQDEILSFADKYERGGKKTGAGMASLSRELPAKISKALENKIKDTAKEVFKAIRAKGMVRVDFMVSKNKVTVTEVNPIPGSMAFYLWEATGISFREQITALLEQAEKDWEKKSSKDLKHKSDIVDKFVLSSQ